MKIVIETVAYSEMRYPTVGDYFWDADGTMRVKVADLGNYDYAFLVALHELVEAGLCQKRGITDDVITAFDVGFEASRQDGDQSEPGDDPASPYGREHCTATAVERLMCAELGISWFDYEQACLRAG